MSTLSRRALLEGMLGVGLSASLLDGCRPDEVASRHAHVEGTLLGQDHQAGHLLRDDLTARIAHVATLPPVHTGVVIAGGGPSGLSAGHRLKRAGVDDFVVLELEREAGGTSLGGASALTAYPWGAHYLPVPHRHNTPLIALLRAMGVVTGEDDDGKLVVTEPHLVRLPEERLYYKGYWYPGLYLEAGASARDLEERTRFEQRVAAWVAYRDGAGRRAFTLPLRLASDAPEVRALDTISASAWLAREGFRSPRLLWLLDYACRDDYGLRLADTSAWALLFYFAARVEHAGEEASDLITWPEGNQALVRALHTPIAAQVRTRHLVLDVGDHGEGAEVLAWDLARDQGVRYRAERAIVALPRFVAARVVRALREAPPALPTYAPWLVANLHLSSRPDTRGAPLAWDNVLHASDSLGYVCATHQRGSDFGPTVLTYYLPLADADARRARARLYEGDFAALRDAVLLDLAHAHPDLAARTNRLDLFRWGHAMVRPEIDAQFGRGREAARQARGRIHFAHSDLSGVSLFEEAFDHGVRAADEVLHARGRGVPT